MDRLSYVARFLSEKYNKEYEYVLSVLKKEKTIKKIANALGKQYVDVLHDILHALGMPIERQFVVSKADSTRIKSTTYFYAQA